jgi:hypothetical protein
MLLGCGLHHRIFLPKLYPNFLYTLYKLCKWHLITPLREGEWPEYVPHAFFSIAPEWNWPRLDGAMQGGRQGTWEKTNLTSGVAAKSTGNGIFSLSLPSYHMRRNYSSSSNNNNNNLKKITSIHFSQGGDLCEWVHSQRFLDFGHAVLWNCVNTLTWINRGLLFCIYIVACLHLFEISGGLVIIWCT